MTKGKFGITLSSVAVLSFVLAFFGYTEILVFLVGYALIIEGHNWLSKQILQALYLRLGFSIVLTVINWIFSGFASFMGWFKAYNAVNVFNDINRFLSTVLSISMLVVCVIAITKVLKEQDANLPVVGELADKSLGAFSIKTQKPQAQPQYAAPAPVMQYQYDQGIQQTQSQSKEPIYQSQNENVQAHLTKIDSTATGDCNTGIEPMTASEEWVCSCGKSNIGKFCSVCGNKNPNL